MTQDPLPEGQWLFRRIFTWTLTILLLALLAVVVWRMPDGQLQLVALWLIGLIGLVVTYYLLAPSAPELTLLVSALRQRLAHPANLPPAAPTIPPGPPDDTQ